MAVKIPKFENHERFFKFIGVDENDCWNWLGFIDKHGYGKFTISGGCYFSHRVSFDIFNGIRSTDLVIDHICKNRKCCNPEHLREVDARENVINNSLSFVSVNTRKTHCPRGHELIHPNIYTHGERRRCKICNIASVKRRRLESKA